jgi:hypothetical protein
VTVQSVANVVIAENAVTGAEIEDQEEMVAEIAPGNN